MNWNMIIFYNLKNNYTYYGILQQNYAKSSHY